MVGNLDILLKINDLLTIELQVNKKHERVMLLTEQHYIITTDQNQPRIFQQSELKLVQFK